MHFISSTAKKPVNTIIVRRKPSGMLHEGLLQFNNRIFNCLLGKGGITAGKHEGDGATPIGCHRILYGFFRHDRVGIHHSAIPLTRILPNMGWCDDPGHPCYNKPVTLPFANSHENMMRDDRLYDICLVLDYNLDIRVRNRGSAIFFHLTSPEGKPTEGCIALAPKDMRFVLSRIRRGDHICVLP